MGFTSHPAGSAVNRRPVLDSRHSAAAARARYEDLGPARSNLRYGYVLKPLAWDRGSGSRRPGRGTLIAFAFTGNNALGRAYVQAREYARGHRMEQPVRFQDLALSELSSLYGYARVLSRNDADAEDLLQESLLKALRAFPSFKPHLSFKVWMFKIMKNAQIDRLRRLRARPLEVYNGEESSPGDATADVLLYPVPLNPEEILLRRVAVEEVREAIRRLPLGLREVVELRELEGLSYEQIAAVIGKPVGTVMSRLFRGRNLVRSALQDSARAQHPARTIAAGLRESYGL